MPEESLHPRISLKSLFKGASIILLAPAMLLTILLFYDQITLQTAGFSLIFIFVISIIFVYPYIKNLAMLTHYVKQLARDQYVDAPDLSFLNNVEELSDSVAELHERWEARKKQLETMVSESRIVVDSLPDILLMLDNDLNVVRTNRRAKERFGGEQFHDYMETILADPELQQTIENIRADRRGREVSFFISSPFPRHYIIRIEHFFSYAPGNIAFLMVMHDITEQKRSEQMLSDFVANASHEIRTPLTSLLGFIETLQTTAKDDPKAREEFLGIMYGQALRMNRLVTDLLSLSKIERNLHTEPTEQVDVAALVEVVVGQSRVLASEKNMVLFLEMDSELPSIKGDVGELTQVCENLVGNAIKYSPEGSEVKVSVEIVENNFPHLAVLSEQQKLLSVKVVDNGEGIAAEHLPRLTERFYRVNKTRSRKIGGTGLGLSIVRHIMERHHGALHIESEEGKGSMFQVLLPL